MHTVQCTLYKMVNNIWLNMFRLLWASGSVGEPRSLPAFFVPFPTRQYTITLKGGGPALQHLQVEVPFGLAIFREGATLEDLFT